MDLKKYTHFVFIPSSIAYSDRLIMFCEVGKYFNEQIIYINTGTIETNIMRSKYPKTTFITNNTSSRVKKYYYLFESIIKLEKEYIVFQDMIIPRLAILHKLINIFNRTKYIFNFISFYFPNTKYYKTRDWLSSCYPLTKLEKKNYNKMFRKRTRYDWISTFLYDGIIGNSSEITSSIVHYYNFPRKNILTIPTAIYIEGIDNNINKPIKSSNRRKRLLYVGSIQPRKEVEYLVESIPIIISHYKIDCELYIVGDFHSNRKGLFDQIIERNCISDRVIFTGNKKRDDLIKYYLESDCFIFPSRWEGSPRVVKEALSYNLPVVAADIPGNRIIDPDGSIINYVPIQSKEGYAKSINESLQLPRKDNAKYLEKFSPVNIANYYHQFYTEIIDK